VWDLDGVIVDSAEAHDASWAAMAREFGVSYDSERDFRGIFGRHNTDIISSLWGVTDSARIANMADAKERSFRAAAAHLKPLPGVLDLMSALKAHGWSQGIGSSAPAENIRALLQATGTTDFIDGIASGDDVTEGKPNPQVFLLAFERLGVAPRNGIVIEDAPAGIQAAVRAGTAAVGVTTTQTRETLLEAGAQLVVNSLTELTVADLEKLTVDRLLSGLENPR
jgi:HAD superfamily hydrolase (TIGR01509 family)